MQTEMETAKAEEPGIDQEKLMEFCNKALQDLSGGMTALMCGLGDKLGLFKALAERPATSEELAHRTKVSERYAREWLNGMAAAGYVVRDGDRRFALTPEQKAILAAEGTPTFFGGAYQELTGILKRYDSIVGAFRNGGGVKPEDYDSDFWAGLERFTNVWFENHLVQDWLPLLPEVRAKLEKGASVADVGCGAGRAVVKLAEAYPKSLYTGFDVHGPSLARAATAAKAAGVGSKARFEQADAAKGLPGKYDVVTMFDVLHDMADPAGALLNIRMSLNPGGSLVLLEINTADNPEDNESTLATIFYGFSLGYCMTSSLASGGAGLGTMGATGQKIKEMAKAAGFSEVKRIDIGNPFNVLYELRA
jgi:2-polyprenyl-3-methyl-5-hydroxy-6-metoxy-1,4-benzoquinol methylase